LGKAESCPNTALKAPVCGRSNERGSNEDLHSHGLKTTFGTRFLQANPDEAREFAELMEHSDLFSQVMKYALPDEERARAEMARL
jgi:site-specific recombinase XerC